MNISIIWYPLLYRTTPIFSKNGDWKLGQYVLFTRGSSFIVEPVDQGTFVVYNFIVIIELQKVVNASEDMSQVKVLVTIGRTNEF